MIDQIRPLITLEQPFERHWHRARCPAAVSTETDAFAAWPPGLQWRESTVDRPYPRLAENNDHERIQNTSDINYESLPQGHGDGRNRHQPAALTSAACRTKSWPSTSRRWTDDELIDWDGEFRDDGTLFLICSERDVDIEEYRKVLVEHIRFRFANKRSRRHCWLPSSANPLTIGVLASQQWHPADGSSILAALAVDLVGLVPLMGWPASWQQLARLDDRAARGASCSSRCGRRGNSGRSIDPAAEQHHVADVVHHVRVARVELRVIGAVRSRPGNP